MFSISPYFSHKKTRELAPRFILWLKPFLTAYGLARGDRIHIDKDRFDATLTHDAVEITHL